jgi:putative membrane protein
VTEMGHPVASGNWLLIGLVAVVTIAYCGAVWHRARRSELWRWRTASFVVGAALLVIGLLPPLAVVAHGDLRVHMFQHLLLGMFAPLALVFAAPVTLLLGSVPPAWARRLVWLLRTSVVRLLSHPVTALLLNIGGMYALYATSLYVYARSLPVVHVWLHVHFVVAGCLFVWAIAGPDPAPHRPTPAFRGLVLFVSVAAHALLAKLMVAFHWTGGVAVPIVELESAAKVMYYGGDLAEVLLLFMLLREYVRFEPVVPLFADDG